MPIIKGLEWTFDTVASTYEKLRPGYVTELYQTIFNYISIDENSNVLEIGSGIVAQLSRQKSEIFIMN